MHTQGAPAWIWSPFPGEVRWSTVATWLLVFGVVTWRMRSPVRGVVAAMVWLCGFEIVYEATGSIVHRWSLGALTLTTAGTGGWLGWAYLSLRMRPNWWLLAVFAAAWVAWIAAGFESNMPDRIIPGAAFHWSWLDEVLNVGTKTLLGAVVAFGSSASELEDLQVRAGGVERSRRGADRSFELEGVATDGNG